MQPYTFDSIICFGGEDWWYHNRGHIDMQLMRQFSQRWTILYLNSIVMQKPNLKRATGGGRNFTEKLIRKSKSILLGLRKINTGFWVYSPFILPVHHLFWLRLMNEKILHKQLWLVRRKLEIHTPMVWVACPAACDVAINTRKAKLVYQRSDRFEEYPNVEVTIVREYDRILKAKADLTVFVNQPLYKQEKAQCRKAIYLDHGVDYEMFASVEYDRQIPSEMTDVPHPIVGFFGGIDNHTSDMKLIEEIVDRLPKMSFVFVGKASLDCNGLLTKKNVWMLGQKPYEQIPRYGKCFDVAIMPWRQNRWIEACNPIKLKEYLALGKPIVSTPFPELQKYSDVVYQAKTPKEFAECIKQALADDNPERIAARRKLVEKATWDSKAQLVLEQLFDKTSGHKNRVDG